MRSGAGARTRGQEDEEAVRVGLQGEAVGQLPVGRQQQRRRQPRGQVLQLRQHGGAGVGYYDAHLGEAAKVAVCARAAPGQRTRPNEAVRPRRASVWCRLDVLIWFEACCWNCGTKAAQGGLLQAPQRTATHRAGTGPMIPVLVQASIGLG